MVTSLHLAAVPVRTTLRCLRSAPRPAEVQGLRHAEALVAAPLGPEILPRPSLGRVGLVAAWDDDAALDRFLEHHPAAARFGGGYSVRLTPTRVIGVWPEFGELDVEAGADDGPVAVLTLGRLRPRRAVPFLRASARAERDALASDGLLFSSGLASPRRLVSTFSMWRDVPSMRAYVQQSGGGHRGATAGHSADPYHSVSAFIRFRPYDETGTWPPA